MSDRESAALLADPITCHGSGVVHWYCCDENLSWCRLDISTEPECPPGCSCLPCVVCEDMEFAACPGCALGVPGA